MRVVPNEEIMRDIKQLIGEGTSVEIRCKGNSMNPFFVSGRDTLVLSPFKPSELVPGCVVLGRDSRGIYLVHRVVAVGDGVLTLNGDGNPPCSVEKMREDEVIAILSAYVRKGKRGCTKDAPWRRYSSLWAAATKLHIGNWSLRRVYLGIWRRLHPDWIFRKGDL